MGQASAGVYEFVFGALQRERASLLKFWGVLGFEPVAQGKLDADAAGALYGHASALESVLLRHPGCETYGTGFVRMQFWSELRNDGLGSALPVVTGSRWMGMYTRDILQLHDSFANERSAERKPLWMSPLVHAPLAKPAPEVDFYAPFVGLRELLVFGERFRLAFIQRAGFDRPGFGTFDESLTFKNTEGSHANVVQPDNQFSTDFYKQAFGFESAPFGEAHDSGDEKETIAALSLRDGETFRIERTRAIDCPSGLLQVYASYMPGQDKRDVSRPGSGNLCAYSVQIESLDALAAFVDTADGAIHTGISIDEFGRQTLAFDAPDGYAWIAVARD